MQACQRCVTRVSAWEHMESNLAKLYTVYQPLTSCELSSAVAMYVFIDILGHFLMQQAANTPSHSHEVTKQPDRNYDSLISKTWVPCWCSPTTASWVQMNNKNCTNFRLLIVEECRCSKCSCQIPYNSNNGTSAKMLKQNNFYQIKKLCVQSIRMAFSSTPHLYWKQSTLHGVGRVWLARLRHCTPVFPPWIRFYGSQSHVAMGTGSSQRYYAFRVVFTSTVHRKWSHTP